MQALLFQGKKLGICIQLYTEFIKRSPPRPSPTRGGPGWGGNRRWNTQYLVRMRTGNDPKPSLKPKISIFAQSCGGNRFTFPTLQFFVTLNLFDYFFQNLWFCEKCPVSRRGARAWKSRFRRRDSSLFTSIWRFRNKFGMTVRLFRHPELDSGSQN